MNRIEKFLMNNPIREAVQKFIEAPLLERMGGRTEGMCVLEIGCGRGVGTEQIFQRFGAAKVYAMDLDQDMIRQARSRLAHYPVDRLTLTEGNATAINVEKESFDAVFDFAILHHIPLWQKAVTEIFRVLKPGGRFYFEEVTSHALNKWSYRTFLLHPTENRFSTETFIAELERQGLSVAGNFVEKNGGDFIFGVASKRAKQE